MNRKPLLIISLTILVTISIAVFTAFNNNQKQSNKSAQIYVNEAFCQQDSDCIWVYTECSSCECGKPVNKKHKSGYENQIKEKCQDFSGPVCEFCCPFDLGCINNTCTKTPNNKCG